MQSFNTEKVRPATHGRNAFLRSAQNLLKCTTALAGSGVLLGTALMPVYAHAQTTGGTDPVEVVVTAQKRSESQKDVPLSITAISGAQIEKSQITDYGDLSRAVPGLTFSNSGNSGLSRVTLRGVSSSAGAATVGIYLDEVSLTMPNQFFTGVALPKLFDLQSVEVLRGPQGTLYGASSMGGTIKFITKKPRFTDYSADLSAEVSGTDGGGTNYQVEGVVNLPVNDKVAMRIGVQHGEESGYIDRYVGGAVVDTDLNSETATAVRATLLYKPNETLSITPAFLWQKVDADDTGIFNTALPLYSTSKTLPETSTDTLFVPSLTVEKTFGDLTLTSVTSYMYRKFDRQFDGTIYDSEYVAWYADPGFGSAYDTIASLQGVMKNVDVAKTWSQEVRLSSDSIRSSGKPYEWQVGAYYAKQTVSSKDDEYVLGITDAFPALFAGSTTEDILGYATPNDSIGYFHSDREYKELALFAEGSLMLTPKLKATAGLRQVWADSSYVMNEGGWLADGSPALDTASTDSSPLTPKVALTYIANDDLSLYANASKGFRLGGQNNALPSYCASVAASLGLGDTSSYGEDSLWSYEAGAKGYMFNGRLGFSASLYKIKWDNIQQSVSLSACGYVTTVNAGKAESTGGELEVRARLTDHLTIGGSYASTDAKVTKAAPGSSATDGAKILGIPESTYALNIDYYRPLSDDRSLFGTLDYSYTGKSSGSYSVTNADNVRSGYGVVNARAGMGFGSYEVVVFAKNLLNEDTIIQRPSVLFIPQGLIVRPRTVGVSVRKSF